MKLKDVFKAAMTWVLGPIGIILGAMDLYHWYLYGSPWSTLPMYLFTFDALAIVFSVGMIVGALIATSVYLIKPLRDRIVEMTRKQDEAEEEDSHGTG